MWILLLLWLLPHLFLLLIISIKSSKSRPPSSSKSLSTAPPKNYPIFGCFFELLAHKDNLIPWTTGIILNSPTKTFTMRHFPGVCHTFTANPANVQHILKNHFPNYPKGEHFRTTLEDVLGNTLLTVDGEAWKYQRQIASPEFNTKSLRRFVETVVNNELSERLIPTLAAAAKSKTVVDLQDILQRAAFDNICRIAFGYDPVALSPSMPQSDLVKDFEECLKFVSARFKSPVHLVWKIKRLLNIGSERSLNIAASHVRALAQRIIREKKEELNKNSALESVDLLSRFLSSDHSDENLLTHIVATFLFAGRDTTSAGLTWFFWLISQNPEAEKEILKEIKEKSNMQMLEDIKDMPYTQASICESMRLYPPIALTRKYAVNEDVLPDGTVIKKGQWVSYYIYAMGRSEELWGPDWDKYKPERWLKKDEAGRWTFVGRDPYTYPVFQAGPRTCIGKDMAMLQMKRVAAGFLRQFRVVPVIEDGAQPKYVGLLTSKMKGGFPVRIEKREEF